MLKKLLSVCCAILFLSLGAIPLCAADIKLAWDAPTETWQYVRIYERTGASAPYAYVKVAEVPGDQTEATVTGVIPGPHTYIARAVNFWEGPDSNAVSTPPVPGAPTVHITITIVVQ